MFYNAKNCIKRHYQAGFGTISGHKTEKAFRKYIKADTLQKAQMIQKIWENRPGL